MTIGTPFPSPSSPGHTAQLALPRSAVRTLAACASSSELCPELELRDRVAARLFADLGGSREAFANGELRCAAFRSQVVDQLAQNFFERHPGALGVGVWPVLGTRSHRLGSERWLDVDAPPVAELRRKFLPARAGWSQQASCLCNAAAIVSMAGASKQPRLFVLDESVLPLNAEVMGGVLDAISREASSGSELVLAFDARAPLRPVLPFRAKPALELVMRGPAGEETLARYPRLRFAGSEGYTEGLRCSLEGINAVATLQGGIGAPALAHLELI